MNISDALLDFSYKAGCEVAFCLTGGMAMHLNYALYKSDKIKTVFVHHETSAIAAADGFSRTYNLTKPGLAIVTSGPAVTNSITGLASSFGDSVPLIVLAGQVKRSDINRHGLRTFGVQEVDQLGLVSRVSAFSARVDESNLFEILQQSWKHLTSGRRGPIFLEVPLDVQHLPASDFSQIDFAAEVDTQSDLPPLTLASFRRPVVLVGNGARAGLAKRPTLIGALAERNIPRAYTWASFDLEPGESKGNLGCPGSLAPIHANRLLSESDLLVSIGARLDLATTAFDPSGFGSQATRIIVDIDSRELDKFDKQLVAHRVRGDATSILKSLLDQGLSGSEEWYLHCARCKEKSLSEEEIRLASDTLTVREVAITASRFATNRVIAVASSGIAEETLTRFFVPQKGTIFFNGAALGSMGLGLAHGIGAASGDSRNGVWIFEGDGGLLMNIQELATLKKNHPTGVALFVLNNSGYASIANSQKRIFNYEFGASQKSGIEMPNWSLVSEAFGLPYRRILTKHDFINQVSAWTVDSPTTFFDIMIPSNESRGPQLVTQIRDGVPHTPRLGELAWP